MNFVEKIIVRKIAEALLQMPGPSMDQGMTIVVDGDRGYDPNAKRFTREVVPSQLKPELIEAIVEECNQYDEVHLFVDGPEDGLFDDDGRPAEGHGPWVYLIFGNGNGGWDVVSDYMTSLEPVLQRVLDFIEKEGD